MSEEVVIQFERFDPVVGLPGPLCAKRHARLPGTLQLEAAQTLFRRVEITG